MRSAMSVAQGPSTAQVLNEEDGQAALPVHRLFFINLDRRYERRARFDQHVKSHGLGHVTSRFPAVDGQLLDLDSYPRSVVSQAGVECARAPPPVVNGVYLTRGALGLILSYNTILKRIAADPVEEHVHIIAEDDAVLVQDFCPRLQHCLKVLEEVDPRWEFLHVGYYDDDCTLKPMEGPANKVLCQPVQIYGLFGAAMRPRGARALLQHLFPLEEQIDSALAKVYAKVRAYASRPSLMKAAHSTADNTDIQILPEGFKFSK